MTDDVAVAKKILTKTAATPVVRQMEEDKGVYYYPAQTFIDAIPGTGGIIATIATKVGCAWSTAKRYCTTMPTVVKAYQDECEVAIDVAEHVLLQAIQDGDVVSAKWYLERKRAEVYAAKTTAKEREKMKKSMDDMTDEELLAIIEG